MTVEGDQQIVRFLIGVVFREREDVLLRSLVVGGGEADVLRGKVSCVGKSCGKEKQDEETIVDYCRIDGFHFRFRQTAETSDCCLITSESVISF